MKIDIEERTLHFKQPAGTSRGVYRERHSWMLTVADGQGRQGIGECAPLPDLSCDASPEYAKTLRTFCDMVERTGQIPYEMLRPYPSMLFGLETAFWDLERQALPARVTFSIPINRMVWMGTFDAMNERTREKPLALSSGERDFPYTAGKRSNAIPARSSCPRMNASRSGFRSRFMRYVFKFVVWSKSNSDADARLQRSTWCTPGPYVFEAASPGTVTRAVAPSGTLKSHIHLSPS